MSAPITPIEETLPWDPELVLNPMHQTPENTLSEPEVYKVPVGEMELRRPEQARPMPVATHATHSHMEMISQAVASGNLEMVSRLMDLQDRHEATKARKAYNLAFAQFKSEAITIVKNVAVTDGPLKGKFYANLFAIVNAATPALSKYGLSASWKLTKDEKDWLEITCILRHSEGHAEAVSMGGPPDVGGAKNAIQARASSVSYLEKYTFLSITGLTTTGDDKDGNGPNEDRMPESVFQTHLEAIKNAGNHKSLMLAFTVAFTEAQATKNKEDQKLFIQARDARKAILDKEPA